MQFMQYGHGILFRPADGTDDDRGLTVYDTTATPVPLLVQTSYLYTIRTYYLRIGRADGVTPVLDPIMPNS